MSIFNLVERGLLSPEVYNHVTGIKRLDFSQFKQPDSIFLLKERVPLNTYRLRVTGKIVALKRPKYINDTKYLSKFCIQDDTASIWVCLWIKTSLFPYHALSLELKSFVELSNCSLTFNDFTKARELTLNSFDDIFVLS